MFSPIIKDLFKYVGCTALLFINASAIFGASNLTVSRQTIQPNVETLRIASARSAVDLGLVEFLARAFQTNNPTLNIHITYGGVLKIIEDAKKGEFDIILTHHQPGERNFVEQGFGVLRTKIMHTEYALVGPSNSDFALSKYDSIIDIMRVLASNEVDFFVPSPKSGTYMKVEELWSIAGISPEWLGYENTGASGYATLIQAAEFDAYSIIEMGTYLANRSNITENFSVLYRGDILLKNTYSLTVVNPKAVAGVNFSLANQFLEFLVSDNGQQLINDFGESQFNSTVFIPAAHMDQGLKKRRANINLEQELAHVNQLKIILAVVFFLIILAVLLVVRNLKLKRSHRTKELKSKKVKRERDESLLLNTQLRTEIEERERIESELQYQATHDGLTGVLNRRAFEVKIENVLKDVKNSKNIHTVSFIDLDKFKIVNDSCGHKAGDNVLKIFSQLVQNQLRDIDTFARLGGDEFGILFYKCDSKKAIKIINQLILTIKNHHFVLSGQNFDIGVSAGIVELTIKSGNVSQILNNADIACYVAKDRGGNTAYLYEPNDQEVESRQGNMKWVSQIKRALENNEFTLFYQPIVSLKPNYSGNAYYELLLRLKNNENDYTLPPSLIPAAERYGLMQEIDLRNIHQLFYFLTQNNVNNRSVFFINLSGQSIASEAFFTAVCHLFSRFKLNPNNIGFEITETSVIENIGSANKFVTYFRSKGVLFSLDDFGAGLSSFSYLKHLPVDFIKIDGSFVVSMMDDLVSRVMVQSTVSAGKTLGINTIVESVESAEVKNELVELGANFVQGFYLQKPKPLDEWHPYVTSVTNNKACEQEAVIEDI